MLLKSSIAPALLIALCAVAAARGASERENTNTSPITAVDSVAITVSDADQAAAFYSRVLTFEKVADREVSGEEYEHLFGVFGVRIRAVRMRLGEEYVELLQFLAPRGRPVPVDSRSNDRWFQHIAIVVSDMDVAYARLRASHVEHASSGPQRLPDWNPNAAGIRAFYFRDPDEHNLEILEFASQGPGVEFLEYLSPHNGRALPADTQSNDLWSWHIILRAAHAQEVESSLRR
jgi:catechol 2,3-dioxygenase-like lactoylglutathione lyase family enzyme